MGYSNGSAEVKEAAPKVILLSNIHVVNTHAIELLQLFSHETEVRWLVEGLVSDVVLDDCPQRLISVFLRTIPVKAPELLSDSPLHGLAEEDVSMAANSEFVVLPLLCQKSECSTFGEEWVEMMTDGFFSDEMMVEKECRPEV